MDRYEYDIFSVEGNTSTVIVDAMNRRAADGWETFNVEVRHRRTNALESASLEERYVEVTWLYARRLVLPSPSDEEAFTKAGR